MIFIFQPKPIEIHASSRTEAEIKLQPHIRMNYDWECIKIISENGV